MKRILMYRWKAYNYKDIKYSFEKMGYEVKEVYQDLLNYDVDEEFAAKFKKSSRRRLIALPPPGIHIGIFEDHDKDGGLVPSFFQR